MVLIESFLKFSTSEILIDMQYVYATKKIALTNFSAVLVKQMAECAQLCFVSFSTGFQYCIQRIALQHGSKVLQGSRVTHRGSRLHTKTRVVTLRSVVVAGDQIQNMMTPSRDHCQFEAKRPSISKTL